MARRTELTAEEIVEVRHEAEKYFQEDCKLRNGHVYVYRDWCANNEYHVGYYGISDVMYGTLYVSDATGDSDVLAFTRKVY